MNRRMRWGGGKAWGRLIVTGRVVLFLMIMTASIARCFAAASPDTDNPVAIVLDRPLFAADRRPVDAPSEEENVPVLTGVVQGSGERAALFRPQSADEEREAVPVGGEILGWKVIAVEKDTVLIAHDGKTLTLHPDYRSAPPAP